MAKLVDQRLMEALRAAGLADDNTRRVVIDIQTNHPPVVYIERHGDDRLIQVVEALSSVEITVKNAEE